MDRACSTFGEDKIFVKTAYFKYEGNIPLE
jgi:hypothetical protein